MLRSPLTQAPAQPTKLRLPQGPLHPTKKRQICRYVGFQAAYRGRVLVRQISSTLDTPPPRTVIRSSVRRHPRAGKLPIVCFRFPAIFMRSSPSRLLCAQLHGSGFSLHAAVEGLLCCRIHNVVVPATLAADAASLTCHTPPLATIPIRDAPTDTSADPDTALHAAAALRDAARHMDIRGTHNVDHAGSAPYAVSVEVTQSGGNEYTSSSITFTVVHPVVSSVWVCIHRHHTHLHFPRWLALPSTCISD